MNITQIYRNRIIPPEHLLLKDDVIVEQDEEVVITKWNTLNPKTSFSHGCSCYFLKEGIKLSKMYRSDGSLLQWYCDIVSYSLDPEEGILSVTDLLADVIVRPEDFPQVVDLDELAEALEKNLITKDQAVFCLRSLSRLLSIIYRDKFDRLQSRLDRLGL